MASSTALPNQLPRTTSPSTRTSTTKKRPLVLFIVAAKGRNASRNGRNPTQPVSPIIPTTDTDPTTTATATAAKKRVPNVKYSDRTGKPIQSSGGQISKARMKKIREAKDTAAALDDGKRESETKAREKFQNAKSKAVPQIVTDRMLSRVVRFSGVPMVLGFTTGPLFYYFSKINRQDWLEPWMFFVASTATFGLAFVGITYGVLSASWDPKRTGTALGVEEFKQNVPILFQTILGKSNREYDAAEFDKGEGEGDYE